MTVVSEAWASEISTQMGSRRSSSVTLVRRAAYFLAASYALGAPAVAILEYRDSVVSERFGYSPELIYLTCVIQALCVVGVLVPRFAPATAATLSIITLGAIVSHVRIGSPLTAVPAIIYTLVQIWFGITSFRLQAGLVSRP